MEDQNKKTTLVAISTAAAICVIGIGMAVYALTLTPPKKELSAEVKISHSHASSHEHDVLAAPAPSSVRAMIVIEYTDAGFTQPTYQINEGETARIENNSHSPMYFAAGKHENHDVHSPINVGSIKAGEASSFVAPKAGSYLFHNHDNDEHKATLVVR